MPDRSRIELLVVLIQEDLVNGVTLRLTPQQAGRRFSADVITCEAVMLALADAGVLRRTTDGAFIRALPHAA
jgi:hypothetical protein